MPRINWNHVASYATSLVLVVAIGCGGGAGSTTTTTPTPPVQTGPPSGAEFLYALGGNGPISGGFGEVYASSLNPSTGQLTEPIDVTAPSLPNPIAMLEQLPPIAFGKYLYAPGYDQPYTSTTVFPYTITGAQGQLSAQSNYPVDFGGPGNIADFLIDGQGRYLYANFSFLSNQNAIQAFSINQSTGEIIRTGLYYVEPNFTGTLVLQAADPAGKYLYAFGLTPGGPEILVYVFNASTGMVGEVPGSPFSVNTQGDNIDLFVSPSGKFLYFFGSATDQSNLTSPALYIFSVDSATGKPTPTAASPIILPQANGGPVFSPSGNLLYMPERFADNSGNVSFDIGVFKVNQIDGTISPNAVSSVSTLYPLYPDPSGKVLLIGPGGSNFQTFWSYLVDDSTGALTPAQGSPFFANDPNTLNQFYTIVRIP